MPSLNKYNSREEEIKDHSDNYRSMGGANGKFSNGACSYLRIRKIVDAIPRDCKVLDIGCNDGAMGLLLQREKDCFVIGIDIVKELVEVANARGVIANVGSADKLEYKNNEFDAVNMSEVLEHLYNPNDALSEICRVLKYNGTFTGSVPHDKGGLGIGKKADYHNWVYTYEELNNLLSKFFSEVKITETCYSEEFCSKEKLDNKIPQWYNFVCSKIKA